MSKIVGHTAEVCDLAAVQCPSGGAERLLSASVDGEVRLWAQAAATGAQGLGEWVCEAIYVVPDVWSLATSDDGAWFVSGSCGGSVMRWSIPSAAKHSAPSPGGKRKRGSKAKPIPRFTDPEVSAQLFGARTRVDCLSCAKGAPGGAWGCAVARQRDAPYPLEVP